jgi:GNAT superfamily N-acetyltransferase
MFTIRQAGQRDAATLLDALHAAWNWDGTDRKSRDELRNDKYIAGWKRPEDFGVVAVDANECGIGAAWFRFLPERDPGYGFVAEGIPELTIGVAEPARGAGAGHALLAALLDMADERGCEATSLSVEDGNAAR